MQHTHPACQLGGWECSAHAHEEANTTRFMLIYVDVFDVHCPVSLRVLHTSISAPGQEGSEAVRDAASISALGWMQEGRM